MINISNHKINFRVNFGYLESILATLTELCNRKTKTTQRSNLQNNLIKTV